MMVLWFCTECSWYGLQPRVLVHAERQADGEVVNAFETHCPYCNELVEPAIRPAAITVSRAA